MHRFAAINMFTWSTAIPLVDDDLWLGMQARNLAVVDMGLIRNVETSVLVSTSVKEKTGLSLTFLSAISQMWVFALYEFLRTWLRQDELLYWFAVMALHRQGRRARTP